MGVRRGLDHSCLEFGVIRSSLQPVKSRKPSDRAGRPTRGVAGVANSLQGAAVATARAAPATSRTSVQTTELMRDRMDTELSLLSG